MERKNRFDSETTALFKESSNVQRRYSGAFKDSCRNYPTRDIRNCPTRTFPQAGLQKNARNVAFPVLRAWNLYGLDVQPGTIICLIFNQIDAALDEVGKRFAFQHAVLQQGEIDELAYHFVSGSIVGIDAFFLALQLVVLLVKF